MNRHALVIMAKKPDAGSVKTRLKGHLSDRNRLALYTFLMEGTIEKLRSFPGADTHISFAPHDAREYFAKYDIPSFPQPSGDIGERMLHAAEWILAEGYENVVITGVDIPDLSEEIVQNAFRLLDECDIVFGPARDGGYYLVGMKKPIREIFSDIQWSSEQTLSQSVERAKEFGYKILFTDTLNDVDTIDDVVRLGLTDILNPGR